MENRGGWDAGKRPLLSVKLLAKFVLMLELCRGKSLNRAGREDVGSCSKAATHWSQDGRLICKTPPIAACIFQYFENLSKPGCSEAKSSRRGTTDLGCFPPASDGETEQAF
jgi:hypothetical protein